MRLKARAATGPPLFVAQNGTLPMEEQVRSLLMKGCGEAASRPKGAMSRLLRSAQPNPAGSRERPATRPSTGRCRHPSPILRYSRYAKLRVAPGDGETEEER